MNNDKLRYFACHLGADMQLADQVPTIQGGKTECKIKQQITL